MFILEKFDDDFDHDYDENKIYYSNVIYKDGFLETIQKALKEQNKKLNLFGKERNPTEVIELVKEIQSKQFHPNSRCDLVYCFSQGYFEIIFHSGNDDEDEYEVIELNLNLTDITKPILSITQ